MEKLQMLCETWQRPDANGLFDYHCHVLTRKKFVTKESVSVSRKKSDYDIVIFCVNETEKPKQNLTSLFQVIKKNQKFLIKPKNIQNEETGRLVCCNEVLKSKDYYRLGKVKMNVQKIEFKIKSQKKRYQQLKYQVEATTVSKILEITPSFYEGNVDQHSMVADNPTCRYCYSKSVSRQNPFIVSCLCKGHTRYVHEQCLILWILKKYKIRRLKQKEIYFMETKAMQCELCKQFYSVQQMFEKLLKYQKILSEEQIKQFCSGLLILRFEFQNSSIYFINTSENQSIKIGRSVECDIVLNQLSVSRKHAEIFIDSSKRTVSLNDNKSKFGTVKLIKKTQELDQKCSYQVGRSKITFNVKKKKGFFQSFGMCFVQERLNKEKKKY